MRGGYIRCSGNVWQWVQDTYSEYKKNAVTDTGQRQKATPKCCAEDPGTCRPA
jgi:formylglycine-generating enzyme required for sulfatase activity